MKRDGRLDLASSFWVPDPIIGYYRPANQKIAPPAPLKNRLSPSLLPLLLSPHSQSPKPHRPPLPKNLFKKMKKPSAQALSPLAPRCLPPSSNPPSSPMPSPPSTPSPPPSPRPAPPSTLPPSSAPSAMLTPLPSPPQKSPQKEEETLHSGPFSPCPPSPPPIFQSPILFDAFATFDSLSATTAEAGASLDLATLGCIVEESI